MRNFVDPKRFYKSSDKASKFMQASGRPKKSGSSFITLHKGKSRRAFFFPPPKDRGLYFKDRRIFRSGERVFSRGGEGRGGIKAFFRAC